MDIFEKLRKDRGPLGKWSDVAHGYMMFPKLEGEIGPRMMFRGKERITWSLNNYLGLANHPEVRKVDADASAQYGLAYPMGSRMMSGNSDHHEQLERDLSEFVMKEDTCEEIIAQHHDHCRYIPMRMWPSNSLQSCRRCCQILFG